VGWGCEGLAAAPDGRGPGRLGGAGRPGTWRVGGWRPLAAGPWPDLPRGAGEGAGRGRVRQDQPRGRRGEGEAGGRRPRGDGAVTVQSPCRERRSREAKGCGWIQIPCSRPRLHPTVRLHLTGQLRSCFFFKGDLWFYGTRHYGLIFSPLCSP